MVHEPFRPEITNNEPSDGWLLHKIFHTWAMFMHAYTLANSLQSHMQLAAFILANSSYVHMQLAVFMHVMHVHGKAGHIHECHTEKAE